MKSQVKTLSLQTEQKQQMFNLTDMLTEIVSASGVIEGIVAIYCQHTTAALFVGEYQAALLYDTMEFLKSVVGDQKEYRHNSPEFSDCERKNAASHLRGLLLSHSVMLPVSGGKPVLGTFQSVILAELDGPRQRTVQVQILGTQEVADETKQPEFASIRSARLTSTARR